MQRVFLLIFGLTLVLADYPPAPGSGNASCVLNADCGIPAGNCYSTRNDCVSLTGTCGPDKRCVCDVNMYACGNCAGQATLERNTTDPNVFEYTSIKPMLDGSGGSVDVCKYPRGGGACTKDPECGGTGMCIGNRCVCQMGWICADCSITETDLLYGVQCGNGARDGGAPCKKTSDCGHGTCLTHPAGAFCQCNALWVCGNCNVPANVLAKNASACL